MKKLVPDLISLFPFSGHCSESTPRRASVCHQEHDQKPGWWLRSHTPVLLHYCFKASPKPLTFTPGNWTGSVSSAVPLAQGCLAFSSINEVVHLNSSHLNFAMVTYVIPRIPNKIPGFGLNHNILFRVSFIACVYYFFFFFKSFLLSYFSEWNVELLIWL